MLSFPFAKINLGLHITGKRADHYHNLDTLFFPVRFLHDALELVDADQYSITTYNSPESISPERNLVTKAFHLLEADYKIPPVEVHLVKRIPSKAGLGGGSSDAASMLMLLNRYFKLNIPLEKLCDYALQLGSDCPFFLHNQPMYGQGRGEILNPATLQLKGYRLILVSPLRNHKPLEISTADAFAHVIPLRRADSLADIIASTVISDWKDHLKNDFQDSLRTGFPEIDRCIAGLYENGALYASLSGSGSACYGLFDPAVDLHGIKSQTFGVIAQGLL